MKIRMSFLACLIIIIIFSRELSKFSVFETYGPVSVGAKLSTLEG